MEVGKKKTIKPRARRGRNKIIDRSIVLDAPMTVVFMQSTRNQLDKLAKREGTYRATIVRKIVENAIASM